MSADQLHRFCRFSQRFPDWKQIDAVLQKSPGNPHQTVKKVLNTGLIWSHFLALISVEEDEDRFRLARKAARFGWTVERLEAEIAKTRPLPGPNDSPAENDSKNALLVPKRGKLHYYQIIEKRGALHLDHGFRSYRVLNTKKKYPPDTIIELKPDGSLASVLEAKPRDLYTYRAVLDRVVDGDTVWLDVLLTATEWINEKLRLRGIDAPEMDTRAGEAAKKFVEQQFKAAAAITITTTKTPDKWDRYLADIYLGLPGGEEIYLNNLLLERGHAVRVFRE